MHTRLNHTQSRRTHSSHQHHWLLNSKSFRKNSIQQEHYHSNQLWNTHISYGKRLQSPVPFQPTTAHASIGIHSHHHNKRNCNLKFSVRQKSEKTIKKQKKMIRVWRIREKRCVLEERVQKRWGNLGMHEMRWKMMQYWDLGRVRWLEECSHARWVSWPDKTRSSCKANTFGFWTHIHSPFSLFLITTIRQNHQIGSLLQINY